MGSQAGELRHPTRSQGGPHVGQQSSTHGGRHVQVDLSPRSVKLSHSASGAVRRSAAGAVLASSGSGGGQAVAATASAAAAAATGFAPSSTMPWLSMVDDDNYAEEVGEEEEEEGEPPHRPARSEASFASLGGRSLSLGGGCRPGSVSGGGGGGGGSSNSFNTYVASSSQISQGYNKELKENDRIQFSFANSSEEHTVTLNNIENNFFIIIF